MGAQVKGLDTVLTNMQKLVADKETKVFSTMQIVGDRLETAVKGKANLDDHTLEELAKLEHPYAERLPKNSGPHPDEFVHRQSGHLYENIFKEVIALNNRVTAAVGVTEEDVPYIKYLMEGTSKMRQRNFLGAAFNEEKPGLLAMIEKGVK